MKLAVGFFALLVTGGALALMQAISLQTRYAPYYPLSAAFGDANIVTRMAMMSAILMGLIALGLALSAALASNSSLRRAAQVLADLPQDPTAQQASAAGDSAPERTGGAAKVLMIISYLSASLTAGLGVLGALYAFSSTLGAIAATNTTSLEVVAPSFIEALMSAVFGVGAALPAAALIVIAAARLRALATMNAKIDRRVGSS